MAIVTLDQKKKQVKISAFELEQELIFEYFNTRSANHRDALLQKAIYIGVLALIEDRISAFFSKTQNELGTHLESLKMIFEMRKVVFEKTAVKGVIGEQDIFNALIAWFEENGIPDRAILTGEQAGVLPKNKTGDILCTVDSQEDRKIAIECKFDKSINMGDIADKDVFVNRDSAWNQLLESQVNRKAITALIVFDKAFISSSISSRVDNIGFIPGVGFVAIVDTRSDDYRNLFIAYSLARDIVLYAKDIKLDQSLLEMLVKRLIKDTKEVSKIKDLAEATIANAHQIIETVDKGLLKIEFTREYLLRFLQHGTLTRNDLLEFYEGKAIQEQYKDLSKSIKNLTKDPDKGKKQKTKEKRKNK